MAIRSTSGLPHVMVRRNMVKIHFALTIMRTVLNGLTLEHSSGAVEGSVNRIKMIKRQMYGRATFGLLRKRILLAA